MTADTAETGKHAPYEIGRPSNEEIPQILQLWEEQDKFHESLDPDYYVSHDVRRAEIEADLSEMMGHEKPHIFVARQKDEVVGFITFGESHETYSDTKIKDFGELKELIVSQSSQNQGIGSALIASAEDYFKNERISQIKIQCSSFNKTALDLYEKRGYIPRQVLLFKRIVPQ